MSACLQVKYPILLSDFNGTSIFSTDFQKMLVFIKVRPMGAELFHADRRTDIKPIVAFLNFAKVPNKTLGLSSISEKMSFLRT
jgi:hypothetical protein